MSINDTLSKLVLIITLIILLAVPSIDFDDYFQSTISSKFLFFSFCTLFLLLSVSIQFLFKRKLDIILSRIDITLLILLLYILFNRYYLHTEFSFSIRFLELLVLSIFYVIIRTFNSKYFIWLLLVIIVSGIVQSIYGGLQLYGYVPSKNATFKITGSYFNPGPFSGVLGAIWPITLGVYLFRQKLKLWLDTKFSQSRKRENDIIGRVLESMSILGLTTLFLILPITRSRAAWLSIIISSVILLEFRYRYLRRLFFRMGPTLRIGLMVILLLGSSISLYGLYSIKQASSQGRLFIWKVTSGIVRDNPLVGVGFDRFKAHYMNYQARYFEQKGETYESLISDNSYYAFNEFLQFTSEEGLLGLIVLMLLIYFIKSSNKRTKCKTLSKIAYVGLLSITIFACFSYSTQILPIKVIAVVFLAILAKFDNYQISLGRDLVMINSQLNVIKPAVFLAIIFGLVKGVLYFNNVKSAYTDWNLAMTFYQFGNFENSIKSYERSYPILSKEGDFLMNYGKALSMAKQHQKAIIILQEAKQHLNTTVIETALGDSFRGLQRFKEAETSYMFAKNMIPARFYPSYLLAKLYEANGQEDKARDMANYILLKEIKVHSTAIKQIKKEMEIIVGKSFELKTE